MSTLVYLVVEELHGREATAKQLSQLAGNGRWQEMPGQLSDEMLGAFASRSKWRKLPGLVKKRYGEDLLDRINFYLPFVPGEAEEGWRAAVAGFGNGNDKF
jgi:hypothetical protein